MKKTQHTSTERPLEAFQHVNLRDPVNQVELILRPGETHAAAIEASPLMLQRIRLQVRSGTLYVSLRGNLAEKLADALTTSLTREHVRVTLTSPGLHSVRVKGWVAIDSQAYGARQPAIRRAGPFAPLAPLTPWH